MCFSCWPSGVNNSNTRVWINDCLLSAHQLVFTLLPPSAASAPAAGAEDELLFSGSPAGGFSAPDSCTQETRRHECDAFDPLLKSSQMKCWQNSCFLTSIVLHFNFHFFDVLMFYCFVIYGFNTYCMDSIKPEISNVSKSVSSPQTKMPSCRNTHTAFEFTGWNPQSLASKLPPPVSILSP